MALHESVLLDEAMEWLGPGPGKTFVDGTVGLGGHALRILEKSAPDGRVIGFDKDERALVEAGKRLAEFGERAMLIHDDFSNIARHLRSLDAGRVDGMLLDLGVSSMQIDDASRGFSFQSDGPLDMRMDRRQTLTARELVNQAPETTLQEILWKYGEERFSRRIASTLVEERERRRIDTTGELAALVKQAVPKPYRYGRIHPATRTFQALRIAVNKEMEALERFLEFAPEVLTEGGRLVVIAFHSLEDRAVKTAFKAYQQEKRGKILTRKPLVATEAEVARNPRSRSAKLRAFVKSEDDSL